MDLFIDGSPFGVRHGESLSRGELFDVVMEELASRGLILKEIISDGEALSEEDFFSLPDGVDVDFISGTGNAILEEARSELQRATDQAALVGDRWLSEGMPGDISHLEEWRSELEWIAKVSAELAVFSEDAGLSTLADGLSARVSKPDRFVLRDVAEILNELCILREGLAETVPLFAEESDELKDEKGDEA